MSSYEQALNVARNTPVVVPEFEAVATASDDERERHTDEDRDAREQARRWLIVAAAGGWLAYPILAVFLPDPFMPDTTIRDALGMFVWMVPMALGLLWAAHLSRDRRLRSNILTRAIAASNFVLALLSSFVGVNADSVTSVLLAIATGRSLQLLAERGLDGGEDQSSGFEPVRFRGVLLLTLILACADAVTLLWTTTALVASYFVEDFDAWASYLPKAGMTAAAAALMAVNIWGLLRLRTWALFTSMLANVGIAALALSGVLALGWWVTFPLAMTAGIQLLLPLPILAAALGLDGPRQYTWVAPLLLRVAVPAAVLVTIAAAILHLRWSFS
jgi:hypothetical protein